MSERVLLVDNIQKESTLSLIWIFLKIGATAFGGFMALISVVQNYVVDRRKLLTQEEMLDGVSLATILPGPIAVNVVAYVGYKINGIWGAFICASAVIFPSFLLILGLSYLYFMWGEIPAVSSVFKGFLPAVAAIIIAAVVNMGRKSLSGPVEISLAITSMFSLILLGGFYSTIIIIVFSGVIGYLVFSDDANKEIKDDAQKAGLVHKKLLSISAASIAIVAVAAYKSNVFILSKLFSTFASMSLLLFGGGFVFIPMIQEIVVGSYGWVTHKEFIDGIALGQVTPGPILISATFIGYKVAGVLGAAVATIGIFFPPAVLMLVATNFLSNIKSSRGVKPALKGIRCGVIGLIAAAAYVVIMSAEQNIVSLMIFVGSLVALLVIKLEVVWVIPIAGALGYFLF